MAMATNLTELVNGYLTPDVVDRASAYVGESSSATQKALTGIVPTVVAGLAEMGSTSDGAQALARTLDSGKYDGSALSSIGSLFSGGAATQDALAAGKGLLDSLFGSKLTGVTDAIARSAGARATSVAPLMALIVPVILHVLGRQRAAAGGTIAALTALLAEQKSFLSALLPAGLASLLGWSSLGSGLSGLRSAAAGAATRATGTVASLASPRPDWRIPLGAIAALILVALAYIWSASPVPEAARVTARRIAELQLPGGIKISVPEGTFNFSLATWLASPADTAVPKRFVFDNLNFETGSTTLTPDSRPTVESLVVILKSYPTVAGQLEGHTDSTGDAAANKKLSLDRATAVKDLLVKGGVADERFGTAGAGSEKPIASNDTEDGRARNRRLELVVEKR
jgi:OOP family OmpA-OmpF porin